MPPILHFPELVWFFTPAANFFSRKLFYFFKGYFKSDFFDILPRLKTWDSLKQRQHHFDMKFSDIDACCQGLSFIGVPASRTNQRNGWCLNRFCGFKNQKHSYISSAIYPAPKEVGFLVLRFCNYLHYIIIVETH